MDDLRVERILRAVEAVPWGRAATYKLIGQVAGEVPRVVGWTMSAWATDQCWWRIVNASGTIPSKVERAIPHWLEENMLAPGPAGIPAAEPAPSRARVDLPRVLMDREELSALWGERTRDLPGLDEVPGGPRRGQGRQREGRDR